MISLLALALWASPGCTSSGSAPEAGGTSTDLAASGEEPSITLSPFPSPSDGPNGLTPENDPPGDGDGDNEGSSSGVMIAQITANTSAVQFKGNTPLAEDCGNNVTLAEGSTDEAGRVELESFASTNICTINFSKTYNSRPSCVISTTRDFLVVTALEDSLGISRPDINEPIHPYQVIHYHCKFFDN